MPCLSHIGDQKVLHFCRCRQRSIFKVQDGLKSNLLPGPTLVKQMVQEMYSQYEAGVGFGRMGGVKRLLLVLFFLIEVILFRTSEMTVV